MPCTACHAVIYNEAACRAMPAGLRFDWQTVSTRQDQKDKAIIEEALLKGFAEACRAVLQFDTSLISKCSK